MATPILSELFEYDPLSPTGLTWKVNRHRSKAGSVAGFIQTGQQGREFWRVILTGRHSGKYLCVHRVIWDLTHDEAIPDDMQIDHIDGNALNNKLDNLRIVSGTVNSRNQKRHSTNTTGHSGVSYSEYGGHRRYMAHYTEIGTGKVITKSFSCNKYGTDESFALAVEWRNRSILELNRLGAGYTDRHGT